MAPNATINQGMAFDPWLLWVAFRKHWPWCIPLGLTIASIIAFVLWKQHENEYQASYLLQINRDYVVFQGLDDSSGGVDFAHRERILLMNGIILDKVLANPDLKSAPSLSNPLAAEREIRKRLGISTGGTGYYLTISYLDKDPKMAANVCNAIVESYLEFRSGASQRRMEQIRDLLAPAIKNWKEKVERSRKAITALTKSVGERDPFKSIATEDYGAQLVELRQRLVELTADEEEFDARLKSLHRADASNQAITLDPATIEAYVNADKAVARTRVTIEQNVSKLRSLEYKKQHVSGYEHLKSDTAALEEALERLEAEARERGVKVLAKLHTERDELNRKIRIKEIEDHLASIRTRKEKYEASYKAEKKRIENLSGETTEIFFAKEDHAQAAAILNQLNFRAATIETEQNRTNGIQVVQPAQVPTFPVSEMDFKKMGLATIASILFPFGLAFLYEMRIKRIVDSKSVEACAHLPVIGEIARIGRGSDRIHGHHLFLESIDAFRSNLDFKLDGVRTIAITSSMPSEGKSSIASQLAISLGKAKRESVLLIDADIRLPGIHELFDLEPSPGLIEVLQGKVDIEEAIDTSLGDTVHVLSAGDLVGNPHHVLSRKNIALLLEKIPARYRYVVFDTSPVLPAAETLCITSLADATLICAMRDVSKHEHLTRAQRLLENSGSRVLGVVFSGISKTDFLYRYGNSHSYAYRV